jgi:hypothetical protein
VGQARGRALRPAGTRRVREVIRAAAALLVAAVAFAARAEAPVAFVADVKGNATIEGDGTLVFLAELSTGTKLLLGSGATVAVIYGASGTEFTLAGPGAFRIDKAEVSAEKGARPARTTVAALPDPTVVARVSRTATASLRMRGIVPPARAATALEYPVDTRVTSLQPEMRWKGDPAMEAATVILVDANGKEIWKASAKTVAIRPTVRLAPGTEYKWTVMTPRGTLGEARFETLSAPIAAKAEKSRAAAKTFPDRVLHAILLQDIGASQEAREAWAALARERPDLTELAALSR